MHIFDIRNQRNHYLCIVTKLDKALVSIEKAAARLHVWHIVTEVVRVATGLKMEIFR